MGDAWLPSTHFLHEEDPGESGTSFSQKARITWILWKEQLHCSPLSVVATIQEPRRLNFRPFSPYWSAGSPETWGEPASQAEACLWCELWALELYLPETHHLPYVNT
jgi:hypothetical protein